MFLISPNGSGGMNGLLEVSLSAARGSFVAREERVRTLDDVAAERAAIEAAVDGATLLTAFAETVSAHGDVVLATQWTADSGELTPTLRHRRQVIAARYQREIDELYSVQNQPKAL
jgi:long-subunit acyl-CoA synthetase (AMP-forming)